MVPDFSINIFGEIKILLLLFALLNPALVWWGVAYPIAKYALEISTLEYMHHKCTVFI